MDFTKYEKTQETSTIRIRRAESGIMRLALKASGDKGFSIKPWSKDMPAEIKDRLPKDTDRRHAIVTAHFSPEDLEKMLTEALTDNDILKTRQMAGEEAQADYESNYQWLGNNIPVASGKGGTP